MGNVTGNFIENALHYSSSSAATSASSAASSDTLPSASSDSKLFDQLRQQLTGDPTKLELYRLLQLEMEKRSTTDDPNPAPKTDNFLRLKLVETMMRAEKASPLVKNDTDDSSSTSSKGQSSGSLKAILCPKKKYLQEYFDDDDQTVDSKATPRTVEDSSTSLVVSRETAPCAVPAANPTNDGSQSSVRSRSNTVSLPMRSRGALHEVRTTGNAAFKPSEQQHHQGRESTVAATTKPQQSMPFNMNSCIDAVVRSQLVGDSRHVDMQRSSAVAERNEGRTIYVIDREHGPASSVAAYNSARHQPRRDEISLASSASIEMARMTAENSMREVPRHMSMAGDVEGSTWSGPHLRNAGVPQSSTFYDAKTQSYYCIDQVVPTRTKAPANGERRGGPQSIERLKNNPCQTGQMSASSYQLDFPTAPTVPPNWRPSSEAQASRMAFMPRGTSSTSWPVHQQPPLQSADSYHRSIEHSREYETAGGSTTKYQVPEAPPPPSSSSSSTSAGCQYGVEMSSRAAAYEQRAGYAVEARTKYVPVDVSRAAYPPTSSRVVVVGGGGGGGGDSYDTARRQVHEQIETMCSLPPPLLKPHVQHRPGGSSGNPAMPSGGVSERHHLAPQQQHAMLPRPLEPVEPTVKPKLAGLMMHAELATFHDHIRPTDSRMTNRSVISHPRDEQEYEHYVQRQPRSVAIQQHQLQKLAPQMISPSTVGSGMPPQRAAQQPDAPNHEQAASFHGQRGSRTVESPLDLSLRRDEPMTMTAEAFLRRVQDPEHYVISRQEYSSRNAYTSSQDADTEHSRHADVRRPEYRQQQQQYQQQFVATEGALSGNQQHLLYQHHQQQQQQQQQSRHESPRSRLESMPDWVSSRAPPIGHPAEQQQQQRAVSTQPSRRPVLIDGSRGTQNYIGVSPTEPRMHHTEPPQPIHGSYVESGQHVASADDSIMVWERRVQAGEKSRMHTSSWEVPHAASMRPSLVTSSSASSTGPRIPVASGMSGANLRMPNPPYPGLQPSASSMQFESHQSSRAQQMYQQMPVSMGAQQTASNVKPSVYVPSGIAATGIAKDSRPERIERQDRQVNETRMLSDWDSRQMRNFESQPTRQSFVDVSSVPFDHGRATSSPSLPQLSPIPSSSNSAASSANAAASRRIPIVELLGRHCPSDILHLRCNVCSQTYGSLRSFRMHFAKQHGLEPGPEHFTIQTISETRTALALGTVTGDQQNSIDCNDDSSLPPPSLTRETSEILMGDVRCSNQLMDGTSLELLQHQRREYPQPPAKQVAEVYPITKKPSSAVPLCRPNDPSSPPEKPSPPLNVVKKRLSPGDDDDGEMRCHKCHQFTTRDWATYQRHVKMHGGTDVPSDKSTTPELIDVNCVDAADIGCAVCLEGFADVADWQSHVRTAHVTSECMMRSCACKSCGIGFTNGGALRRHLSATHGVVTSKRTAIEVEYRCLFCPDTFNDERMLYVHTQAHEHNYMLQRSSSSSMPVSRRYSFVHGAKQPETSVHCVQTAVPDTTCPEELRPLSDSVVSAGNSKSGSDDSGSLSSEKSPETDVVEDGNSSGRVSKHTPKRALSGGDGGNQSAKTTAQWAPRADSLKASILRRLSANQDAAAVVPVVKLTTNSPETGLGSPTARSASSADASESAKGSSSTSARCGQGKTVFGDLVTLMHRTVESSLREFINEPALPPTSSTSISPLTETTSASLVSSGGSSSSPKPTRCVRDVCDAIIANSFQQVDESLAQHWLNNGTGDYLSELSRCSLPNGLPLQTSSPSKVGDTSLPGSSSPCRTASRSNSRGSEKSSGSVLEVNGNKHDGDRVSCIRTETTEPLESNPSSKSPGQCDVTAAADSRVTALESGEAASSDSENQASDLDDQPPLCIDLNRVTSDDEEESPPCPDADDQPEASADNVEKASTGGVVEKGESPQLIAQAAPVDEEYDMREKPFRKRKLDSGWDSAESDSRELKQNKTV